jgi:hypothetical protein
VTGPGASDHWFDRLATGMTRRTALKAGLAAAAAIALPLTRVPRAAAFATDPCARGCVRFAQQRQGAANAYCENARSAIGDNSLGLWVASWIVPVFAPIALGEAVGANRAYGTCIDKAMTAAKVAAYDCYQPGCSGFDPKQPGGPCDTCEQNCCVCPGIPNGFICCFYDCGDPNHNCCGS